MKLTARAQVCRRPAIAAHCCRDRGAGTLVVVGLVAAVLGIALLLAPIAGLAAARHRAAAGADAAALASAAIVGGFETGLGSDACAAAEEVAASHRAELGRCEVDGLIVTVRVDAATAFGSLSAWATAGPAS